jgi:hypothetical protein
MIGLVLFGGRVKEVANTEGIGLGIMLDEIRANHIDVSLIIWEELEDVLPQLVEDIVRSVYQSKVVGVWQ